MKKLFTFLSFFTVLFTTQAQVILTDSIKKLASQTPRISKTWVEPVLQQWELEGAYAHPYQEVSWKNDSSYTVSVLESRKSISQTGLTREIYMNQLNFRKVDAKTRGMYMEKAWLALLHSEDSITRGTAYNLLLLAGEIYEIEAGDDFRRFAIDDAVLTPDQELALFWVTLCPATTRIGETPQAAAAWRKIAMFKLWEKFEAERHGPRYAIAEFFGWMLFPVGSDWLDEE